MASKSTRVERPERVEGEERKKALSIALANIEKHAKAAHVAVRIEPLGEDGFRLEVCDDGIGIPEHAEKDMHFGLSIMRERAQALKADIRIERRAEGGTRVLVERSGKRTDR